MDDPRELTSFAHEIHAILPETAMAALYRPDQFAANESESRVIIELLRVNVQDFLRRPLASTELRQLFDRLFVPRATSQPTFGKILSFISNKGGVGKSTLSVSTACELARRHPGRVLLVDASLQLGICALMLDLVPPTTILDAVREKDRLDETLLRRLAISHPCGLQLLAAPTDAVAASEIDDASVARVLNLARRTFDYVVVDTFPMLDSIVMSTLDLSDFGFVVLQGTAPSIVGIAKLLPVLAGIGFPKERQRVILNQNYRNFAGNLKPEDMEDRIGRPIDYVFPYQKRLLVAMNTGNPYILRAIRYFGFGREMRQLVDDIEALPSPENQAGSAMLPPAKQALINRKATA